MKSRFPRLDYDLIVDRLSAPRGQIRVLIDTDAANEIDDQFALVWALRSTSRFRVEAVTACPFSFAHHLPELQVAEAAILAGQRYPEHLVGGFQGWLDRLLRSGRRVDDLNFVSPQEGMELSFEEILRVYDKLGIQSAGQVYKGADRYITAPDVPVVSKAAETIIDLANSSSEPLYIAALGCLTNVASAILLAPEIIRTIVVVWTSAYPSFSPHSNRPSLNLVQDVAASRILFDSGVPHVYLPGYHVGAQLKISRPEMERFVRGKGAAGDYLYHLFTHNPLHEMFVLADTARRTWVIWDMINIAWLINPEWVPTFLTTSPILNDNLVWVKDISRHAMLEGYDVQRDEIFLNFYDSLLEDRT